MWIPVEMTIDAAIFDLDGLLLDTERYSERAFHRTTSDYGLGNQTDLFLSLVGTNEDFHNDRLSQALGHLIDPRAFRRDWIAYFHQSMEDEPVPLLPGVQEMLNWLNAENITCAVATSSTTPNGERKLKHAGIREFFHTVTCGDQVSKSKPHPDIYLKAAESIGADLSRSIALEDSPNGVKAAHAAGLHVIQVPNLVQPSPDLLELGHRVCSSMHHVLELVQRGQAIPSQK